MSELRIAVVSVSWLVLAAGCGPVTVSGTSVAPTEGHGSLGWADDRPDTPPAFRKGMVMYAGREFVLWCDWFPDANGTKVTGGVSCDVSTTFADGTPLVARCESPNKRAGPVTIGQEKFELADGNLFLVAGPSDRPRVKQLKRDLSGVNFKDRRSFQSFGQGDREITAFFTDK